jgi:hypothetical protein
VRNNRFVVMLLWVSFGLILCALLLSSMRFTMGLAGLSLLGGSILLLSRS